MKLPTIRLSTVQAINAWILFGMFCVCAWTTSRWRNRCLECEAAIVKQSYVIVNLGRIGISNPEIVTTNAITNDFVIHRLSDEAKAKFAARYGVKP